MQLLLKSTKAILTPGKHDFGSKRAADLRRRFGAMITSRTHAEEAAGRKRCYLRLVRSICRRTRAFPSRTVSGPSGHPCVNAPNSEQPERRRIAESRCATAQNRRDKPRFVFPAI